MLAAAMSFASWGSLCIAEDTNGAPRRVIASVLSKEIFEDELEPEAESLAHAKKRLAQAELEAHLTRVRTDKLSRLILDPLLERHAAQNNLGPTEEEIQALLKAMAEFSARMQKGREEQIHRLYQEMNSPDCTEARRQEISAQLRTLESLVASEKRESELRKDPEVQKLWESAGREVGMKVLRWWKVTKHLYATYGGHVYTTHMGWPDPKEAYVSFLKDCQEKRLFEVFDDQLREAVLTVDTNRPGVVRVPDEDAKRLFEQPLYPWGSAPVTSDP